MAGSKILWMVREPHRAARCLLLTFTVGLVQPLQAALTLEEAVTIARDNDPWLKGSELRESALLAESSAAGTLPDPVVSVGVANLPTDSWDFDQEAMTQFKVGVMQRFPRGDSRELERRRLEILGSGHPHQRSDRRARLAVNISQLWLEAYRARETIRLIEHDRELFEHLVDVAQSSYASALGRTRQQDLVRAQLNPALGLEGIVLTMVDQRNNLSRQVESEVRRHFGEKVYRTRIPRNVRLSEAPSHGKPIILYDIHSRGAVAYLKLAEEMLSRISFAQPSTGPPRLAPAAIETGGSHEQSA